MPRKKFYLILVFQLCLVLASGLPPAKAKAPKSWEELRVKVLTGDFSGALKQLESIRLKKLKKPKKLKNKELETYFLKAVLLHKNGKSEEALKILEKLKNTSTPLQRPIYQYYQRALQKTQSQPEKNLSQLQSELLNYRQNKRWDLAVKIWPEYAKKKGALSAQELEERVEDYFKARNYAEAAFLLQGLTREAPELFDRKKKIQLSQAYARSDQFDRALRVYKELLTSANPKEKSLWQYKIAYNYFDRGNYPQAIRSFESYLKAYPKDKRKKQALWLSAWAHYHQKQYKQARVYFGQLESEKGRNPYTKSLPYWRARSYEKEGKKLKAKRLYQKIARSPAETYYAFLSLKRLQNNWKIGSVPTSPWIRNIKREESLGRLPPLPPQPKEKKSTLSALYRLGLMEDFLLELALSKPPSWAGAYQKALTENWQRPQSFEHLTQGYPTAYSTWVRLYSDVRKLPPHLAWAIMRAESFYNPQALSPADARGLMQIIPPTAEKLAADLGKEAFRMEKLLSPSVSVEMGVHYLWKNLHRFKGNLVYTIASYNAGEEAVERWLKVRGNLDWDEFVESIPYRETRNYVKKVLRFFYYYKILYGDLR